MTSPPALRHYHEFPIFGPCQTYLRKYLQQLAYKVAYVRLSMRSTGYKVNFTYSSKIAFKTSSSGVRSDGHFILVSYLDNPDHVLGGLRKNNHGRR